MHRPSRLRPPAYSGDFAPKRLEWGVFAQGQAREALVEHIRIAPSVLAADFARLGEQIAEAEAAGSDLIHFDVMDGRFVPNITMGPVVLEAVRRSTTLPIDVHLMMIEPDHMLPAFAKAGANRIDVHIEACPNLHRTLQTIKALGCKAGVAINPHTPASFLSEVMPMLDAVLVMTVNPGFGGQEFLPETLPKIRTLRQMIEANAREDSVEIAVDGGINRETAPRVVEAGANMLVIGSALFSPKHSIAEGMSAMRRVLGEKEKPV